MTTKERNVMIFDLLEQANAERARGRMRLADSFQRAAVALGASPGWILGLHDDDDDPCNDPGEHRAGMCEYCDACYPADQLPNGPAS